MMNFDMDSDLDLAVSIKVVGVGGGGGNAVNRMMEVGVQVNGKIRVTISVPKDQAKEAVIAAAKEALGDKLNGTVVKEIYVPGRIVNIVVKP